MNSDDLWAGFKRPAGLLVDTNLLVLFVVGSVNLDRIENFKRTRKYTKSDYHLLLKVLDAFKPLYTLAHVMAEVSNLTDLSGPERLQGRFMLKETLAVLQKPEMASVQAVQSPLYESLGLVDAPISTLGRGCGCAVLTDDLDLYLALSRENIVALNFTHLRERVWGV